MNNLPVLQSVLNCIKAGARRHFTVKRQLLVVGVFKGQRGHASATGFVRRELGDDCLRGFRLLGQDQLQVMSERVFDGNDASGRAAMKMGMIWEGRLRSFSKVRECRRDVEMYSILRSEWAERQSPRTDTSYC